MRSTKKAASQANKKQKESGNHLFSLLGSVVFFAIVVGVAVGRNKRVREEIDHQIKEFLATTKELLTQYQQIANKISNITAGIKTVSGDVKKIANPGASDETKSLPAVDEYEMLWEPIEAALL